MPAVHVRNVSEETIALLKRRAAGHGNSLEAELREILLEASDSPGRRLDLSFESRVVLSTAPEPAGGWSRADAYSADLADGR